MYEKFFGLTATPFSMTPDPALLYMTDQHREALAGITYALAARKGFVVIVGEPGTGKTTVLSAAVQFFSRERLNSSIVVNPLLTSSEFLETVLHDFKVPVIPQSKPQRLLALLDVLEKGHQSGKISTVVVDEAHLLSAELLEEIRLLGNIEKTNHKLLQIVLAGQLPLNRILNRDDLTQLKQRVALRLTIHPLMAADVEGYLRFRWTHAGGNELPLSAAAIEEVRQRSRGFPRLINSICDSALVLAFAEVSRQVSDRHIRQACSDLDIAARKEEAPARSLQPRSDMVVVASGSEAVTSASGDRSQRFTKPLPIAPLQHANETVRGNLWTRCAAKLGLVG